MEKFLKYDIKVEKNERNPQQCKFVISPLEKGMGNTLGNALRRTMLFDIPGSSIFAVKVNDATHEFQAIEGVKEDVTQIILNLKGLAIKIDENAFTDDELAELTIEKWPVMEVSASGKCVVKASDIKTPAGFEIVNKGLYICELTSPESKLDLKLYARRGRGFVTFTQNHDEIKSLGIIATDSNFSPIIRVGYSVEDMKLSKSETCDSLTVEIATNGAISPSDALAYAAKLISDYLQPIVGINEHISQMKLIEEQKREQRSERLSASIEDISLSVRSYNCLKRAGIQTIHELTEKTRSEVEKIKNLGRKSLREIQKKLIEYGLSFKDERSDDKED